MNKQRNDRNAFNSSLGSVGRLKGRWQNYPTGSPQRDSKQEPMKGSLVADMKEYNEYWDKNTPKPPPISERMKFTIASLKLENRILNYQNNPIPKDPKERASSTYFRSSIQKRLVAGVILINTLENKCTTQKQIREKTGLSKGIVSKVCNECVEAGWFHLKFTDMNVPCYMTDDIVNNSASYYTKKMWSDTDDPILIEFCRRFDIMYMQNKLDEMGSRGEP